MMSKFFAPYLFRIPNSIMISQIHEFINKFGLVKVSSERTEFFVSRELSSEKEKLFKIP